jgi:hypothetical protein
MGSQQAIFATMQRYAGEMMLLQGHQQNVILT